MSQNKTLFKTGSAHYFFAERTGYLKSQLAISKRNKYHSQKNPKIISITLRYDSHIIPISDMGMIWESNSRHNAKKQEFIHNYFVSVLTHNFSVWRTIKTVVVS